VEELTTRAELKDNVVVLTSLRELDKLDDVGVIKLTHDLDLFEDVGAL